MARGKHQSPTEAELPKAEYQKIEEEVSNKPFGVHDMQARSYGYNDFSEFQRPDHYIRHIEPLEIDLARQVEYDMDEQDKEWLDMINEKRRKAQEGTISYEVFEIIMDRLEKEWFDLTKNIPKPDLAMPSEDSTCAICDDSEGENSNAIVFCDGCNLAVHQDCYGVPYIPEGQWLCRKCTVSPENPVQCILCPNEGGAFKQTTSGDWVHLLCAIWIPETRVANEVFMEPITGVDRISKSRWKLRCSICDFRDGACIQCSKASCFLAFHVTCARKQKLLLPMKGTQGSEPVVLTCYCERHLTKEQQDVREAALAAEDSQSDEALSSPITKLSKSARAYARTYKPGPPLVPAIIVNRIITYIGKVSLRKKSEFVQMVCRYWSLKREARRGAPLLKRLHLEPWTVGAGTKLQTDEEKRMKLDMLQKLREDLSKVRELAELTRKRETRKYRQAEIIHHILSEVLLPHDIALRRAFDRIQTLDRHDYFKNPVSRTLVPDYFDIVKKPMCWTTIETKLDQHQYWDIQAFKDDIELVLNNAILYNKPGTPLYKTAVRIRNTSQAILQELDSLAISHETTSVPIIPPNQPNGDMEPPVDEQPVANGVHSRDEMDVDADGEVDEEADADGELEEDTPNLDVKPNGVDHEHSQTQERSLAQDPELPSVGDLEPPLDLLEVLVSSDLIQADLPIELHNDPISSLFDYEFAKLKPPPPPPPPRPKKQKPKRDRKAEAERLKARKEAAAAAAAAAGVVAGVDGESAAGDERVSSASEPPMIIRIPRTRRATAVAAAFEAEANTQSQEYTPEPNGLELTLESPSSADPSTRPRKRPSISLPSHPMVVEDVDDRDSFSLFNAGWILPAEQKRGGRASVDKGILPPPKKRPEPVYTGRSRLSLSVVSTPASENQTLYTSPVPDDQPTHSEYAPPKIEDQSTMDGHVVVDQEVSAPEAKDQKIEDAMDIDSLLTPESVGKSSEPMQDEAVVENHITVDTAMDIAIDTAVDTTMDIALDTVTSTEPPAPLDPPIELTVEVDETKPIINLVESPGGTVTIEELDTPSTRKQKYLRKRAKRQQLATSTAPAASLSKATLDVGTSISAPAPRRSTRMKGSEYTLSEAGSEAAEEGPRTRRRVAESQASKEEEYHDGMGIFKSATLIKPGLIVTFPWWPAMVYEAEHPDVNPQVYKQYKSKLKKKKSLYLVRFFDAKKSWGFMGIDCLRMMGEHKALDDKLVESGLEAKGKGIQAKEFRDAFQEAMLAKKAAESTESGAL
ncbi:hypothetical protein BDQ17DRAFT_1372655 [Cyathus striatus]|nr:hypothetical protein BDQ17DRAFT_1372655 [Cyathus striatus]